MSEPVVENVQLSKNDNSLVSFVLNVFNKNYLYIGLVVGFVVGVVLYYLFIKNKKDMNISSQPQEFMLLQKQLMEQQMINQQLGQQLQYLHMKQHENNQQNNVVLEHPNKSDNSENTDDINKEILRIQSKENQTTAQHNLTQSDLEEIKKKFEATN